MLLNLKERRNQTVTVKWLQKTDFSNMVEKETRYLLKTFWENWISATRAPLYSRLPLNFPHVYFMHLFFICRAPFVWIPGSFMGIKIIQTPWLLLLLPRTAEQQLLQDVAGDKMPLLKRSGTQIAYGCFSYVYSLPFWKLRLLCNYYKPSCKP